MIRNKNDWKLKILILLAGAGITAPVLAGGEDRVPVLTFSNATEEVRIQDELESLADPSGSLDITAVRRLDFEPFAGSPGYASGAFWYRTKIHNAAGTDELVLEITYPVLDHIDLYVVPDSQAAAESRQRGGDALAFAQREFHYRNFAFPLHIARGTSATIYLRVETDSSVQVPIVLRTEQAFHRHRQSGEAVLAFYYGGMIIMAAYNFFLFFALRDRSYLHYVALNLSLVFILLVQNGLAYQYLWPTSIWWNDRAQALSVLIGSAFTLAFCRSFLGLRSVLPRLDLVVRIIIAAIAVASVASLHIDLRTSLRIASLAAITAAVLGLIVGFAAVLQGRRAARFYLLAEAALILFAVPMALRNFGLLPHSFFTTYGLHIGSLIEVTLLSFALADRINIITQEREQARARATKLELRAARERESLLADFHDHLGGNLTDIHVLARRLNDEQPQSSVLTEIAERSRVLMHNFQDALSAGDDLRELQDNFIEGLRLILLRRYARAERPLLFETDANTERRLAGADDDLLRCIHAISRELVTNDLKYGAGTAEWELRLADASNLQLRCTADTRGADADMHGGGRGLENIRARLAEFDGELTVQNHAGRHEVRVLLRLNAAARA